MHNIRNELDLKDGFKPYLSRRKINGKEITIHRDTGSVCHGKLIKTSQLNGEVSWVKQPLVQDMHCLPIAEITLELSDESVVTTKAIVVDKESDINYYILGNETHKLTESNKCRKPRIINAVTTRSQTKKQIDNRKSDFQSQNPSQLDCNPSEEISQQPTDSAEAVDDNGWESNYTDEGGTEQQISLPDLVEDEAFYLSKVGKKEFANEQKADKTLEAIKKHTKKVVL